MHEQMGFRGCSDDGPVAVGAVTECRTSDVCAVAVVVFGIVTAGSAQTVGCTCGGGGCERVDGRDVVAEIGVHVGVVDTVVKAGIGDGHDDARAVQT